MGGWILQIFLQGRLTSQRERAWDRDWPGLVTSNGLSNLQLLLVIIIIIHYFVESKVCTTELQEILPNNNYNY